MGIETILRDHNFNLFFSVMVGVGIVCLVRPICNGPECTVTKPPQEADFDKYVYRMSGGKCYKFDTEIVTCPASGAIEAFRNHGSGFSFRKSGLSV